MQILYFTMLSKCGCLFDLTSLNNIINVKLLEQKIVQMLEYKNMNFL